MEAQRPTTGRPGPRRREGCEWCIFGAVRWIVDYAWTDSLHDQEAALCDRCVQELQERATLGLAHVWTIEET